MIQNSNQLSIRTISIHSFLLAFSVFATSVLLSTFTPGSAFAHDGDHDSPAAVQAPKGGDIKGLEDVYIEVLSQKNEIKIYFYSKDLKPLTDLKGFTISAEAQLPRDKQMTPLILKEVAGALTTSFHPKSAHRFTLILKVKDAKHDHADRLSYTIETRR